MADQEMQESQQTVDLQKHHPTGVATVGIWGLTHPYKTGLKVVSTVNWGCRLDLRAIALRCRNAVYNPKRLPILIVRIGEPKTTAYIFASGNMICIGAKSELQNKTAARKYTRIMQKVGFPAKFEDFKIRPNNTNFRKWLKGFIAHSLDGASSSLNSVDEVSESIKKLTI